MLNFQISCIIYLFITSQFLLMLPPPAVFAPQSLEEFIKYKRKAFSVSAEHTLFQWRSGFLREQNFAQSF